MRKDHWAMASRLFITLRAKRLCGLSNQQYDTICPNDWRWPKCESSLLM